MSPRRDRLSRRSYLALAGAGLAGLAGCADGAESDDPITTGSATATPTDHPTGTATRRRATETSTETDTQTPTESETETPDETDPVSEAEQSLSRVSFEGAWFDTHAHWRQASSKGHDDYDTDALVERQREHDVGAAVLFTPPRPMIQDYEASVQTLARSDVDFLPFFHPAIQDSPAKRRAFYEEYESVYYGVGEVTFYAGRLQGMALNEEPIPSVFDLSASADIPLMFHPTATQLGDVGQMLSEYPDATLLLHGHESLGQFDQLRELLGTHDNLYWTADVTTMLEGLPVRASGKSDFLREMEDGRERYLNRASRGLASLLEAAPDRVMWGTDVLADWHTDPEVYGYLMSFSADVRDALPSEHRDPYAYENAVGLFGE